MSIALHQSAAHWLTAYLPAAGAQRAAALHWIAQHREQCRTEAQPGDACADIDCPGRATCPARMEQHQ